MSNEVAVTNKTELMVQIQSKLEGMLTEQIKAFPEGFNQTRFLQNCMAVLADTKDIEQCRPLSVVRTLIKGAYLDLDFFRKECYVVPFNNNIGTKDAPKWVKDAQFLTDYKGERKLCMKYGRGVKDIYAKLVQEGDLLEIKIEDGVQKLNFTPKQFNDGEIQGAFAVVLMDDGTTKIETMSKKELEGIRNNYSKIPNSPAYAKSLGEMYKKIVMRRVCKMVDLHFNTHEQESAYEDGGDAEFKQSPVVAPKVADPFLDDSKQTAVIHQDAEIVHTSVDPVLFKDMKAKFPQEDDWQIEVRVKEMTEGKK